MIPEPPPTPSEREWLDRIVQCTISIGKTIEARKLKPNEVPLVLGGLVKGLADQTSLPVDAILAMVSKAAHSNETPENEPAFSLTLT